MKYDKDFKNLIEFMSSKMIYEKYTFESIQQLANEIKENSLKDDEKHCEAIVKERRKMLKDEDMFVENFFGIKNYI